MLDMAFASLYFNVDCFTVVVADAKAKADTTTRFGTRSGQAAQETSMYPIENCGRWQTAGEPCEAR
ncbi:MAG: hypothetical protein JWQ50_3532 [Caballeronia mineralivorans]|jgi:hypothetical protein|nr:hypothetical protein [Caballeronia mineralivorans]